MTSEVGSVNESIVNEHRTARSIPLAQLGTALVISESVGGRLGRVSEASRTVDDF